MNVQIVSAPWCKRCQTVKPSVAEYCKLSGATLTYVEYDEMEEDEKVKITALPTIRMRLKPDDGWTSYTADTISAWQQAIMRIAVATSGTDF